MSDGSPAAGDSLCESREDDAPVNFNRERGHIMAKKAKKAKKEAKKKKK